MHGHVRMHVERSPGDASGGTLLFSVSDTGIGIPAAKIDEIFEPFAQADASVARRHGGSGLGLSLVRRLVALMGGAIWVRSIEGEGTAFVFTVRCDPPALRADDPSPSYC